jgi:hypothetical protein
MNNEFDAKDYTILGQKYAFATASLILGISSFVSLLGLEKAILAIVFGWLALRRDARTDFAAAPHVGKNRHRFRRSAARHPAGRAVFELRSPARADRMFIENERRQMMWKGEER